jgi:hypothetical protein
VFLLSWYKLYCVLARSRYNFDRSCVPIAIGIIPGYKFGSGHWRSVAVQTGSKPEICQGAGFKLLADERVRVQEPLQICLSVGAKAKTVTNNLHILSVLGKVLLIKI